jgi:hypothetical protein
MMGSAFLIEVIYRRITGRSIRSLQRRKPRF